jgi:hypothetical protein
VGRRPRTTACDCVFAAGSAANVTSPTHRVPDLKLNRLALDRDQLGHERGAAGGVRARGRAAAAR